MVSKTDKILNKIRKDNRSFEPKSPIATGMYLPNHSGDHQAGRMLRTPSNETDLVNKKYVDDNIGGGGTWTDTSTNTGTNKTFDSFTNQIEADQIHIEVRNESGSPMTRGQLVYVSGYNLGLDRYLVSLADADDVGTHPVIGILDEDIANNQDGHLTNAGRIVDLDTSAFSVGDSVYMTTTPGEFGVKPTGVSSMVQAIGTVLRSNANNGVLAVVGAGRTNDIPNDIDHTSILNIGTNSHIQLDTHLALTNAHIDWTNASANFETIGTVKINGAGSTGGTLFLNRNETIGTGEILSTINFTGNDPNTFDIGADIKAKATENWETNKQGTDLIFHTTLTGTTALQDNLIIKNNGDIVMNGGSASIANDMVINIGSITSISGAISFNDENLSTTGTLAAGATTINGTLLGKGATNTFGVADTTAATVRVTAGSSGNTGGILSLDTAPDHDTTIASYRFQCFQDDLFIGPNTDIDALEYDGGTGIWRFNNPNGIVSIGGAVFNESGLDNDFRIEGLNQASLFVVNAGLDRVIITGLNTTATILDVNASDGTAVMDVKGNGTVFNEGGLDKDFRVESDNRTHMLFIDGSTNRVGIASTTLNATFTVDQLATTGAIPTLTLDQADVSEGFVNFIGSDRGAVQTASGAPTTSSAASVRVEVNGTKYLIPLFPDA